VNFIKFFRKGEFRKAKRENSGKKGRATGTAKKECGRKDRDGIGTENEKKTKEGSFKEAHHPPVKLSFSSLKETKIKPENEKRLLKHGRKNLAGYNVRKA